ncbi:hypothetical protein BaRGS_00014518 [Batillaria attramentaria]|uniref:Uncharacterized protein n=1 Tax=Batillaria attramentaria TaxID=370345 RepID=A0ABD0L4L5_9CAEN
MEDRSTIKVESARQLTRKRLTHPLSGLCSRSTPHAGEATNQIKCFCMAGTAHCPSGHVSGLTYRLHHPQTRSHQASPSPVRRRAVSGGDRPCLLDKPFSVLLALPTNPFHSQPQKGSRYDSRHKGPIWPLWPGLAAPERKRVCAVSVWT